MLDAVLSILHIHTSYVLTGAGGGFVHVLHDRKLDPKEVTYYMLAAIVLANFIGPFALDLVLMLAPSAPIHTADAVGFGLGYGVSRFCRFADRYIDKNLKPYEGPEHE